MKEKHKKLNNNDILTTKFNKNLFWMKKNGQLYASFFNFKYKLFLGKELLKVL